MKKNRIQKAIDLHKKGLVDEAYDIYRSILNSDKDNTIALSGIGFIEASRKKFAEAIIFFERAVKKENNNFGAFFNKGICEFEIRRFNDSIESFQNTIKINPNFVEAYNNCGNSYRSLHKLDLAIQYFTEAIKLNGNFIEAYINRSYCFKEINKFDFAYSDLSEAYKIDPGYKYLLSDLIRIKKDLCDFDNVTEFEKKLIIQIKNNELTRPFTSMIVLDDPELQQLSAKRFTQNIEIDLNKTKKIEHIFNKKIKIGYFSSDFYNHATMHVMADIFELHDKTKFETFAFSLGNKINDEWRARAEISFDNFIDVSKWNDNDVAEYCRKLNLDIAIDLKGFTKDSRMGIFALQPAPIIINYLGSPCTLGSKIYDFIIADAHVIPESLKCHYSEEVVYLPKSYYPAMRYKKIENQLSRSSLNLPENKFIFCSFNNNYKITPNIFRIWCELLKSNLNSILWILCSNDTAKKNLINFSTKMNIDKNRIIFAEHLPRNEHLMRLSQADLFLDTFPCGGHTSASDALRAGVPVISLSGNSFASRVARSLLIELGLDDLSSNNIDDYFKLALEISKNTKLHNQLKLKLNRILPNSKLFDPEYIAKNLDDLFLEIISKRRI